MTPRRLTLPALALVLAACAPEPGPVAPPPVRHVEAVAAPVAAVVTPREERASRSSSRLKVSKSWSRGDWKRWPVRFERAALCIARHESINAGLWKAENPVSSASGAFQIIDSTWRVFQERANVKPRNRTAHASDAPPRRQARVWHVVWPTGKHHWRGTNCPGTS